MTGTNESEPGVRACRTRLLCLGNELLGDDALGHIVAERITPYAGADTDIVSTPEAGFHLLDYILNTERLIVVDTVITGKAPIGTIYVLRENELKAVAGSAPHYVGLCESFMLAQSLGLPVAKELIVVAVEVANCLTVGGEMHSEVRHAIPRIVNIVRTTITERLQPVSGIR